MMRVRCLILLLLCRRRRDTTRGSQLSLVLSLSTDWVPTPAALLHFGSWVWQRQPGRDREEGPSGERAERASEREQPTFDLNWQLDEDSLFFDSITEIQKNLTKQK
jgi:hypothetical protein